MHYEILYPGLGLSFHYYGQNGNISSGRYYHQDTVSDYRHQVAIIEAQLNWQFRVVALEVLSVLGLA